MVRGFLIWPQNSNQVKCDPFWAKKLSKIGKIPDMANFRHFFRLKGGLMLLDFNFDTTFGIHPSFNVSWDPICYYFNISNFWP